MCNWHTNTVMMTTLIFIFDNEKRHPNVQIWLSFAKGWFNSNPKKGGSAQSTVQGQLIRLNTLDWTIGMHHSKGQCEKKKLSAPNSNNSSSSNLSQLTVTKERERERERERMRMWKCVKSVAEESVIWMGKAERQKKRMRFSFNCSA